MRSTKPSRLGVGALILVAFVAQAAGQEVPPLKDAKLNIEHNATDGDTGFQGFVDSDGWTSLAVTGPGGEVLRVEGLGALGALGLTELFFETVEPLNVEVPLADILAALPEGEYAFEGVTPGEGGAVTKGVATLSHAIPAGPQLVSPVADAVVPVGDLLVSWAPVTETITGAPVEIIAYQLIVEKDGPPHPHMIGKFGLSLYLAPSVTAIELPEGFLEPGTAYKWEVLAIEAGGNQTLSSSAFATR